MTLKEKLRTDLTASMKARDSVTTATLRMALTAITNAEVAGKEAVELTDEQVTAVLAKEVKKRHESIELYEQAGRDELAANERAEAEVLEAYLPKQLTDGELSNVVGREVAALAESTGGQPSMKQMGLVIKAVKAAVGTQADGSRIAAAVKAALA